jgi:hypothetical protein
MDGSRQEVGYVVASLTLSGYTCEQMGVSVIEFGMRIFA